MVAPTRRWRPENARLAPPQYDDTTEATRQRQNGAAWLGSWLPAAEQAKLSYSPGTIHMILESNGEATSPIPESARVLYTKNPLFEVVCQVRFPPILRIEAGIPASFQERIRNDFPFFSEEEAPLFAGLPPDLSRLFQANLVQQAPQRSWKFESEDRRSMVALTREFFSLTTTKYTRWEDFRALIQVLLAGLQAEYAPSFLTRVGLRYENMIVRSELGLNGVSWSDLLQAHIAAEFACPGIASSIREAVHRVLIDLAPHGKVNLRHGVAQKQDSDEICYVIDNDFFTEEKMEVVNVIDRLNVFNKEAGRLFRWCISNRLDASLGPTAAESTGVVVVAPS
jgi:uncharacterized protein (TIGR04255 family)